MSLFEAFLVASVLGWPYIACRAPEIKRKTIMKKAPMIIVGRRPQLSRKRIAGRVKTTLMIY
jgi:hypothetical protein